MPFEPSLASGWRASLALGFERRGERSVLADRRHDGPLVVQKPLYPEGDDLCHAIIVHPPGGIAGGDDLDLAVHAGERSRALLTTPGAAKWYRSNGAWAKSRVRINLEPQACVEWLPQEAIVFDHARADMSFEADLAGDAILVAWEIVCLGRSGSGEGFDGGEVRLHTRIARDGALAWRERGYLAPGTPAMTAAAGLAGEKIFATLIVAAPRIEDAWLAAARAIRAEGAMAGVTRLPGLLLARYRGQSSEAARAYCAATWKILRGPVLGREAIEPRIWLT
jgi:urease accessory protein